LSSILACHSAGLSVYDFFTDIKLDSSAGHLGQTETCLLVQAFLAQLSIATKITKSKKKKKDHPGAEAHTLDIEQHGMEFSASDSFFLPRLQHS